MGVDLSKSLGDTVVFTSHKSVHASQNQLLVHTDLT